MNKTGLFLIVILGLTSSHAASAQGLSGSEKSFRGEVADTQCALGVHSLSQSHKEMMGMKPDLKTSAECTRFCVKERGGKFVLQSRDKIYRLDKPEMAELYAGQQVKIVGTLDPKTNTITLKSITPIVQTTKLPKQK